MNDTELAAPQIHALADVLSVRIGPATRIWQFCVVLPDAIIGKNCNICSGCFIENDVSIGDNVTVKNNVAVYDGVTLEDDVFVGPCVVFTNDPRPHSGQRPPAFARTVVKRGASIGANATLVPGIVIGEGAMIAAGAVVTADVPPGCLVKGCPARVIGAARAADVMAPVTATAGVPELPVARARLWPIKTAVDRRGSLAYADFEHELPFVPNRFFSIYEVKNGASRGGHAHRASSQFFIATSGVCRIVLDDGRSQHEVVLSDPGLGLWVEPRVWCTLHGFSPGASVMVFASGAYDAVEYIRSYEEFRGFVGD